MVKRKRGGSDPRPLKKKTGSAKGPAKSKTPAPAARGDKTLAWLRSEEARLMQEIEELVFLVRLNEDKKDVGDEEDWAQALQAEGELLRKIQNRKQELAQVRTSIERYAAGEYGYCEDCGTKIPTRRLQLMPWVTRCVACQANVERAAQKRSAGLKDGLPWARSALNQEEDEV